MSPVRLATAVVLAWALAAGSGPAHGAGKVPNTSGPTSGVGGAARTAEGERIDKLFLAWRFAEGEAALAALSRQFPGTAETLYLEGHSRFLSGDYTGASAKLRAAQEIAPEDPEIGFLATVAINAGKAIAGHKEARSAHFVLRYPPEDQVLVDYGLEALETMLQAMTSDLGFVPSRPIHIDIYRSPSDLAAVSTLTEEEVKTTGTIALCKWARLMATSPRALSLGYPWLDSLAHELVHYVVSALTFDRAPVWFQEGFAKFLEKRWRAQPSGELPPAMQHLLAKALSSGKLISFERMHPSMAKLPTAEDASLAFAEVATAMASLHAKGGTEALKTAIAHVRDGEDARKAVAAAAGGTWPEFERHWKAFMAAQKYRTFPGMEPVKRSFRKSGAIASKKGPSEDEEALGLDASSKFLRLGNMMLRRNRTRSAVLEYEKGAKAGGNKWVFAVKLGRTHLLLGQNDRALKSVTEIENLYPELPWPHLIAGQALLGLGQPLEAIASLEKCLATNPFDPNVHCALAEAYGKLPADPATAATAGARKIRAETHCRDMRPL